MIDPNLPPEIAAEQQRIARRKRVADLLMRQGMTPVQSVSPRSPVSWTQGAAQMLSAYLGRKADDEATQADAELGQKYQRGLADEVARVANIKRGQTILPDPQEVEQAADQGTPEPQPVSTGNPRAAIQAAMLSQYPQVRQMGMLEHRTFENEQTRDGDRQARLQERLLTLEARARDQAAAASDRAEAARQAQEARRELAESQRQFVAQQNDERRRFEADQRQREREHRRELAQDRIEARRQEKLDATKGKTDEAKQRVSVNLQTLSDYYDELTKLGASIDTTKGGARNLSARVRASGAGQLVGGALGTEEQSYRNRINQMRPLLLQEIRQASAMGARGLDSNKELEFYLQAATDPARDIQANRAALQVLENAYGLNSRVSGVSPESVSAIQKEAKEKTAAPAGQPSAGPPPGIDPAVWNVMTPQERALWRK